MESATTHLNRFMSVGTKVMIFTEKGIGQFRFLSAIRGWRPGSHILLDRPKTGRGTYASLKAGDSCIVRYVFDGCALAFASNIVELDTHRVLPCLRLPWPDEIQCIRFRQHERIHCRLPCHVAFDTGQAVEGELRDLSIGGCGVALPRGFRASQQVELSFSLPDDTRVERVAATVRSERAVADECLVGFQFSGGDQQVVNDIGFYVSSTLKRRDVELVPTETALRALIVDDNVDTVQFLRQHFEVSGFDVVSADNIVDCMHRLRMAHPSLMLINQGLDGLEGVQLCRLIKARADFNELPVFIYGGHDPALAPRARQAGAAGYYESANMAASCADTFQARGGSEASPSSKESSD